jgi:hypothetical protein
VVHSRIVELVVTSYDSLAVTMVDIAIHLGSLDEELHCKL